jgi:Tol biopolymer transport system component
MDVYVMSADGTNQRRLAAGCCQEWSPSGRMLAFARSGGIYVINADGTGLRLLVASGVKLCCELDWSPDGSRIAFTGWSGGIRAVRTDGKGSTQLTRGWDSSPRWSPDGRKVLFTRHVAHGGNDVFVMNADGSHVRRLTHGYGLTAAEGSSWSPWSPTAVRWWLEARTTSLF